MPVLSHEPLQISANGVVFRVESEGFGVHAQTVAAAVRRLQIALADFPSRQLVDPAVLEELARDAVQHETAGWRCWQPGYRGEIPRLILTRVAA